MNICPNCGNAILGHPKECATCKFDIKTFELLLEEQKKVEEEKNKENIENYNVKPVEMTQVVKKENPYENEFNNEDTFCLALGIFSLAIGIIAGALFGVLGGAIGLITGIFGLIRSIEISKEYEHEPGTGYILSLLGTVFSGCVLFGAIVLGSYLGLAGAAGNAAVGTGKACVNGCVNGGVNGCVNNCSTYIRKLQD